MEIGTHGRWLRWLTKLCIVTRKVDNRPDGNPTDLNSDEQMIPEERLWATEWLECFELFSHRFDMRSHRTTTIQTRMNGGPSRAGFRADYLLAAGETVDCGPVGLRFAGIVGDYKFLGGFALDQESFVCRRRYGERVARPG